MYSKPCCQLAAITLGECRRSNRRLWTPAGRTDPERREARRDKQHERQQQSPARRPAKIAIHAVPDSSTIRDRPIRHDVAGGTVRFVGCLPDNLSFAAPANSPAAVAGSFDGNAGNFSGGRGSDGLGVLIENHHTPCVERRFAVASVAFGVTLRLLPPQTSMLFTVLMPHVRAADRHRAALSII